MQFTVQHVSHTIENDILIIAFADSHKPDPDNYLILQREVDNLDFYDYEVNRREYSGNGGIKRAVIAPTQLVLHFRADQKIHQDGITTLTINHATDAQLAHHLHYLLTEADCDVQLLAPASRQPETE